MMSKSSEQEIDYFNQIVLQLYQQGQYNQGLDLALQVLMTANQVLSEDHPQYAMALSNLGILYQATGNPAAAEPILHQALEVRRKSLGEYDPYFAQSLNNLAELYRQIGNYAAAEPLYKQALAIRRRAWGDNHPGVATILNNQGLLYQAAGDYTTAESSFVQALAIDRAAEGEESLTFARDLNNLGVLYQLVHNYTKAEPLHRQALEIRRSKLGENNPLVTLSLDNLAALSHQMGNYTEAERLFLQVQKTLRTALGENHPDVATNLNNLGELYRDIGSYAKAETCYLQALQIWDTVQDYPSFFTTATNLGLLYQGISQYELAETILKETLEVRCKVLGENHPDVALSLNNLAALYVETGNYAAAEPLYRQALELRRRVLPENHSDIAQSLNNLGVLYLSLGNYSEATPILRQALEIYHAAERERPLDLAEALFNIAHLCIATHHTDEAMAAMEQALALEERVMGQVFSIGSENQRLTYMLTIQGHLDAYLSTLHQYLPHTPGAVLAGLDKVLRRKAIGAEALIAQRDAIVEGHYPALAPKLQELTALRSQIAQKTLEGSGEESLETYNSRLAVWNEQKNQLEAELARQIPEMNLKQQLLVADRQSVARNLPEHSALIEFVEFQVFDFQAVPARGEARWKPAHYLAFVLPSGEPDNVQMIDLGEVDTIDQRIAAFRESITGDFEAKAADDVAFQATSHDSPSLSEPAEMAGMRHAGRASNQPDEDAFLLEGRALHALVFDPLITALKGYKRLFLAPDGDLTRVPFEVLPTNDDRYLIDDYHISYLSVGRDALRFNRASTRQVSTPLVVAAPDFDLSNAEAGTAPTQDQPYAQQSRGLERNTLHFSPLPGTIAEGEQIALYLGTQPLLGREAVKGTIRNCHSPRILHIATHGFFLPDKKPDPNDKRVGWMVSENMGLLSATPENPLLRSGLALAGANTWQHGAVPTPEAENGHLTAEDVSGLDLLGTELAVLSACDTGLGQIQTGEGVLGLRRSFMLAGVKTLVMSLWKVPDQQTQELMVDFYRRLLEDHPRLDALQEAQQALRAKYPHPRYWGAFILQGNPGHLAF